MPEKHTSSTGLVNRIFAERVLDLREVPKSTWDDLVNQSPTSSVFLTREFLSCWYNHYTTKETCYLLKLISDCGEIVGIAPLFLEEQRSGLFHRRVLRFAGSNHICAEYLDFIIKTRWRQAGIRAISDYLSQHLHEWDALFLSDIPSHSNTLFHIGELARLGALKIMLHRTTFILSLPSPWESFISTLKPSLSKKIAYYERRLIREFDCEFGHFAPAASGLDYLYSLHQARWGKRGIYGTFSANSTRSFHKNLIESFEKGNMVRLYFLKAGGAVVAVILVYIFRKRMYYYNGGFDPNLGRYNVATVLLSYILRQSIEQGFGEFDFLRGQSSYKIDWGAAEQRQVALSYEQPTIKNWGNTIVQDVAKWGKYAYAHYTPEKIRQRLGQLRRTVASRRRLYE